MRFKARQAGPIDDRFALEIFGLNDAVALQEEQGKRQLVDFR
ncbi:MAG: hypothetical protein ACREFO_19330 [Acetobacteraceae bacterium]